MKHEIKLSEDFADAVYSGEKSFEVRENDRGYQKGDLVRFSVVDRAARLPVNHPLNECEFEITYVLNGWGVDLGYCVFSIKKKRCDEYPLPWDE